MSKLIDITGNRYNNLTVIERVANNIRGQSRWKCLCDCGNYTEVTSNNLKSGAVKSCGCLRHIPKYKHNLSHTKLYRVWAGMKRRCYYRNDKSYKNYGGRGIHICDEWVNDFVNFYNWAIQNGYEEGLTIERINNDENYSPNNCTWIPKSEQVNNRRNCILYTYNNKTQNLKQWCDELNLDYGLMHDRIRSKGWSFERAISTPCNIKKRNNKSKRGK